MPGDDVNKERELRLLIDLGQALIAAHGYGAEDTVATFVAATELAKALGDGLNDKTLQYAAIYGHWSGLYIRSIAAPAHAERLLALTEDANDQNSRLVALRIVALERLNSARFRDALACADEIVENYDPVTHRDLALRYGHDALVAASTYRSWSLCYLGYADQAIDAMDATVAWALVCAGLGWRNHQRLDAQDPRDRGGYAARTSRLHRTRDTALVQLCSGFPGLGFGAPGRL